MRGRNEGRLFCPGPHQLPSLELSVLLTPDTHAPLELRIEAHLLDFCDCCQSLQPPLFSCTDLEWGEDPTALPKCCPLFSPNWAVRIGKTRGAVGPEYRVVSEKRTSGEILLALCLGGGSSGPKTAHYSLELFCLSRAQALVGKNRNWLLPSTKQRHPGLRMWTPDWPVSAPVTVLQEKGSLFQIQCLHLPPVPYWWCWEWLSYFCGPVEALSLSVALR